MGVFDRKIWRVGAAAVLAVLAPFSAFASPDELPEAFVRRVYALYGGPHGPGVATDRRGGAGFYSKALLDGFAKSDAVPDGDVGPIDYDPLCGCQDYKNLRLKSLAVDRSDARSATVRVSFVNEGETSRRTLLLDRTPEGWRIADIQDSSKGGVASVSALLKSFRPGKAP